MEGECQAKVKFVYLISPFYSISYVKKDFRQKMLHMHAITYFCIVVRLEPVLISVSYGCASSALEVAWCWCRRLDGFRELRLKGLCVTADLLITMWTSLELWFHPSGERTDDNREGVL